ncbi:MAG: nitronate monooxygenase [Rhodospirillales bacterium]
MAQGIEAGGHRGVFDPEAADERLSTAVLVRLLVRQTRLPVIAAGGIMDGQGIRRRWILAPLLRNSVPRSSYVRNQPTPATVVAEGRPRFCDPVDGGHLRAAGTRHRQPFIRHGEAVEATLPPILSLTMPPSNSTPPPLSTATTRSRRIGPARARRSPARFRQHSSFRPSSKRWRSDDGMAG